MLYLLNLQSERNGIERKNRDKKNYMWEINHPFPYEDSFVINKTIELESFLEKESITGVVYFHSQMRDYLNKIDYEYMIWQEWKEGYARYIENLIRKKIGIKTNSNKIQPKLNRISFYEIGSKYIHLLIKENPNLKNDLNGLYYKMLNP